MRHLLPVVSCLVFATPAFSQTVDANGAAQLADDLSRYIGKSAFANQIVTVAVAGGSYRIALDFKALMNLLPPQAGAKIDIEPLSLLAKPRADGNWEVAADGLPAGSFEFDGPQGHQSAQWSILGGKFSGVYDPALAAFLTASGSQFGLTMSSKEAKQEMQASTGPGTFVATGVASPGGVDFTFGQTVADFVETVQVTDDASGVVMPVTIKASNLAIEGNAQGYRTRALLDLLAFVVANADEALMKANQAELKNRLLAVLPVWNRMEASYRFGDFTTETQFGSFGAKTLGFGIAMDGALPNGTLTYKFSAQGMAIPLQLLPPWTVQLLPTEFDVSVSGVGFNLDSMARKLIDGFDLNREPPMPEEVTNQIAAEFMAKPPKVVISRSTVKNGDTELAAEGEVTFVGTEPEVNVTFEVAGYDKLVEGVQTAAKNDPEIGQYLAVALAAKGFAKTLPDGRIQWVLVRKADGSVSVNGAVLKGPDAQ